MPNLFWKSDFVSILSDISFDRWGPNCESFQFWNCKPWSYLPAASTWCDDVCDGHIMLAVVQKYVNGPAKQVPQVQFGMPITETDKHPTHWDLHILDKRTWRPQVHTPQQKVLWFIWTPFQVLTESSCLDATHARMSGLFVEFYAPSLRAKKTRKDHRRHARRPLIRAVVFSKQTGENSPVCPL